MSKAHRGRPLRSQPGHGRGECPVCKKTKIKILYEQDVNGQKVKVCKYCNASLKNRALKEKSSDKPSPA